MKKIVLLVALMAVAVIVPAQTYKEWKSLAEDGDYEARCKYAMMTFLGDGCKADEEKGRMMLEDLRSEFLDTSKAAYLYAYSYMVGEQPNEETGLGIMRELMLEDNRYVYRTFADRYLAANNRNADSARYYIDRLVAKNDAYGLYLKGLLQIEGDEVYDRNVTFGVDCLQKSVAISNEYACLLLGEMYMKGENVEVDLDKACEYYNKAPRNLWNSSKVQLALADIYWEKQQADSLALSGERLVKLGNYDGYFLLGSAAKLNGDIDKMLAEYEKGAKQKNNMCLTALGDLYSMGKDVSTDYKKAARYYEEANTVVADYSLAKMLIDGPYGNGTKDSYDRGLKFLQKAASQGYIDAIYDLARIYEYGTNYTKINYDSAMVYLTTAADEGIVEAIYLLGLNYDCGNGVNSDKTKALKYMKKASAKGFPVSLCYIGEYYRQGLGGLDKNCDSAWYYYNKATLMGVDAGLYYQGCCYLEGCGVNKDTVKAIQCFEKVISGDEEDGYNKVVGDAYAKLGSIYKVGGAVAIDVDLAIEYYKKSVEKGSGVGCYELGLYMMNDNTEEAIQLLAQGIKLGNVDCMVLYADNLIQHANLDKTMMKEGYKLYKQVALKYNDARGYAGMGLCEMNGQGCVKDESVGMENLEKAAIMGNASAQYYAGISYMTGVGCDMNTKKALELMTSSAKQDDVKALNMLGNLYVEGGIVKKNPTKGFEYYKYAAEKLGSLEGYCNMGMCYKDGVGVIKNDQKAFVAFQMAAQYNYPRGQFLLGNSYRDGLFVKVDINEAIRWYKLAANQNYADAFYNLGSIYNEGIGGIEPDKKLAKEYFQKATIAGYELEEE